MYKIPIFAIKNFKDLFKKIIPKNLERCDVLVFFWFLFLFDFFSPMKQGNITTVSVFFLFFLTKMSGPGKFD